MSAWVGGSLTFVPFFQFEVFVVGFNFFLAGGPTLLLASEATYSFPGESPQISTHSEASFSNVSELLLTSS